VRLHGTLILLGISAPFGKLSVMARAPGMFEKLVLPGPLIGAHAKLEKTCKSCHEPFQQKSQTGLCFACHRPIAADRRARRNFHGRRPEALKRECKTCHTEHKGRTFDIVQLNREPFNHAFTNFSLAGSHKRASCDGCHAKTTNYRETPGAALTATRRSTRTKAGWAKSAKVVTARRAGGG
jgi:Cytochrome c3